MQLATIRTADGHRCVRVDGEQAIETGHADVRELLDDADWRSVAANAAGATHAVADLDYAPVVPSPEKIICVGKNYADHIAEMGGPAPEYPTLFPKYTRSLTGPNDDIVLPPESSKVDWEAELTIVIGDEVRRASADEAAAAIAGYTIMNDISMRDWQRQTSQFTAGKVWEACTPVGPVVQVVEPGSPSPEWDISCAIDGDVRQDSNTRHLVFDAIELVRFISTVITLVPGDLIATGTPGGVGAGRSPQVFLEAGQSMTTTIGHIGSFTNRIR